MKAVARFTMATGDPVFAGHFPDHPVVPGAWLLDQVLYALDPSSAGWRIAALKFLSPVGPGETVELLLAEPSPTGTRAFELDCAGRRVASGSLAPHEAPA